MTPLQHFYTITQALSQRPFAFLTNTTQQHIIQSGRIAVEQATQVLVSQKLETTPAFQLLQQIKQTLTAPSFNELLLLEALDQLLATYQLTKLNRKTGQLLDLVTTELAQAKKIILPYYAALKKLNTQAVPLSPDEQRQRDFQTIQQVGMFYVLELTLYVLQLLPNLSKDERKKILYEGLKTAEANVPSYLECAESFRNEFCLQLFDTELRNFLLRQFYDFEDVLHTESDITRVCQAFKLWHIDILTALSRKGVQMFEAKILTPFGQTIPLLELIAKVEALEIN